MYKCFTRQSFNILRADKCDLKLQYVYTKTLKNIKATTVILNTARTKYKPKPLHMCIVLNQVVYLLWSFTGVRLRKYQNIQVYNICIVVKQLSLRPDPMLSHENSEQTMLFACGIRRTRGSIKMPASRCTSSFATRQEILDALRKLVYIRSDVRGVKISK